MASGGQPNGDTSSDCEGDDSYDIFMLGCSKCPEADIQGGPMLRFDTVEKLWKRVDRPIPGVKRYMFAVVVVDNTIWVLGGAASINDSILKSVFAYDPRSEDWSEQTAMLHARKGLCASAVGNWVYAIGGESETADGNAVEYYDGGTWRPSNPMIRCRHSFATAVAEHRIYAAGGTWNGVKLSTVEYCSPETCSWTELTLEMTVPRANFQLAVIGDKIYAVGGDRDASITSIDSMYTDDKWITEPLRFPLNWPNHTSVVLNGHIYVAGWFFNDPNCGQFRRLQPTGTPFTINLPPEIRFNGARLAVLKMRPCEKSRLASERALTPER